MHYGAWFKEQRMKRGWSQAGVARRVGVTRGQMNNIEGGRSRASAETLQALCAIFETTPAQMLADMESKPVPDLLPNARQVEGMVLIPVLGRVTAGGGGLAEEHVEGYRHIETTAIPAGQEKSCFLVEARGESMVDAGINDGDLLLVCTTVAIKDGDVAIVDVDGEAMVKRVYVRNGSLLLVSENPAFAPLTVDRGRLVGRVMHRRTDF